MLQVEVGAGAAVDGRSVIAKVGDWWQPLGCWSVISGQPQLQVCWQTRWLRPGS